MFLRRFCSTVSKISQPLSQLTKLCNNGDYAELSAIEQAAIQSRIISAFKDGHAYPAIRNAMGKMKNSLLPIQQVMTSAPEQFKAAHQLETSYHQISDLATYHHHYKR